MGEQTDFCPNHTHFSKYFSHPQITRSCTLDADHSSIPNNALCLPHSLSQKKNWGGGGGGEGELCSFQLKSTL